MNLNKLPHTHWWRRLFEPNVKLSESLWICAHPSCYAEAKYYKIKGKDSGCTTCGMIITLDKDNIRRANPKCLNCSNTAAAKQFRQRKKQEETVKELLGLQ